MTIDKVEGYISSSDRADKTLYLGVQTNILCMEDRFEYPKYILSNGLNDFTTTIYLGKIIFEKNEQGNLAPKYIPSQISELDFENLNPFWLNEINPNSKKPFKSMIDCKNDWEVGQICIINPKAYEYQKIYYYRTKHNITLSKEQILSYFTELHTKNTQFIQAYIDEINKNKGIKAYTNIESHYDKLAKEGIIPPKLLSKYNDGTYKQNKEADLIVLDYLKSNNEADFMILLNDESFYDYLVWSLRDFLIPYPIGKFQDENELLFNLASYKKYKEKAKNLNSFIGEYPNMIFLFYKNILPSEPTSGYIEYDNEKYLDDFKNSHFYSLNQKHKNKFSPSPLGNYYFELEQDRGVYIEYFQRIYPSIDNPPKAWTKEMMKKLDLKLE